MLIVPVILCGGMGSRLWPVSRAHHPKPFMSVTPDGETLLAKTYQRACGLSHTTSEIMTVTRTDLFLKSHEACLPYMTDHKLFSFVLESHSHNTAPAITAAALELATRHNANQTVMLVLPADHLIDSDSHAFQNSIDLACELIAQESCMVTFGIEPTYPATGYGYIEHDGYRVIRFIEKPDQQHARDYLNGRFLWNAGIFCFTLDLFLTEMQTHGPDIFYSVEKLHQTSVHRTYGQSLICELQPLPSVSVPHISIDYALMEVTRNLAVVPLGCAWSDVGSWLSVFEHAGSPPNEEGNRSTHPANTLLHDSKNCSIHAPHRLVGAVGVEDLLIIDTDDVLLVTHQNRAQDVKKIYEKAAESHHKKACQDHQMVHRPWGTYSTLGDGPGFRIKRIEVKPGAALSLQMHYHRNEHWVIVQGIARITNGDHVCILQRNESTYIPASQKHRLENPGKVLLILIEVQTGDYLEEDDIVRFEDQYGRH